MKVAFFIFLVIAVVVVECSHIFLGTNVGRPMVHHQNIEKGSFPFTKKITNFMYTLPPSRNGHRVIQGILAIDTKNTEASANVTSGGIGYNFVNLRLKSERGRGLHYDVYIYA